MSTKAEVINEREAMSRSVMAMILLFVGMIALLILISVSISLGAANIDLSTVWSALFEFKKELTTHQIIRDVRIPRALAAALIGSFLAVSGSIMQGVTRNPLASPSIMGVTAGSAFLIAIAFAFFPETSSMRLMFFSFLGAGLGAVLVFMIASFSKGPFTPVKLALAGTAISVLLSGISSTIAIHYQVAQDISFWYAGGVSGANWNSIQLMLPVALVGLGMALFLSRSITVINCGEEVAKGLGQRIILTKVLSIIAVLLLTGAAVSVGGTIGFIGLIIPHITRFIVGVDYRWIIPCSAVLGALLLVIADILARMIEPPYETPVGAITTIIGVPFFLYLVRSGRRG